MDMLRISTSPCLTTLVVHEVSHMLPSSLWRKLNERSGSWMGRLFAGGRSVWSTHKGIGRHRRRCGPKRYKVDPTVQMVIAEDPTPEIELLIHERDDEAAVVLHELHDVDHPHQSILDLAPHPIMHQLEMTEEGKTGYVIKDQTLLIDVEGITTGTNSITDLIIVIVAGMGRGTTILQIRRTHVDHIQETDFSTSLRWNGKDSSK